MNDTKKRYLSKTIRSQLISVVCFGLAVSGVIDIDQGTQGDAVNAALGIAGWISQIIAIYWRVKAKRILE